MLTKKKRRILFCLSILIFFMLLFPVLLYSLGYGITRNLKILKTGGVFIQSSETGAEVRANGKLKRTSLIGNSVFIKNLLPGNHKVSVGKNGFRTWEKTLTVDSETVTSRTALLVPQNIPGRMLGTTSPKIKLFEPTYPSIKKYWLLDPDIFLILGEDKKFYKNREPFDAASGFGTTTAAILASKKKSLFLDKNSRLVYWDDNSIDSYWIDELDKMPIWPNTKHLHIFSSISPIRGVIGYPGWPGYLIIAFSNGIWILEMDSSGGQNIFPIYKGKAPEIIFAELGQLILEDEENFIELEIP